MDKNTPGQKPPLEAPIRKTPHNPEPMQDPDLTPDSENPINPRENPPQSPPKEQ
jgi:hypothetical protein